MHVNKRLDRFKQWAGERMGGEVKTNATDDFKTLEQDMNMRHEGMERLQKSMTTYIRALSKRNEGDDKEKPLAVGYLGGTMVHHGENFECDSEFGRCLVDFGRTNERIARIQEQYISNATNSWGESIERSLTQMKEYQAARKKLETRRLAYDTSLAKVQKAKREDYRVEEDLRTQKVKYEEASDDVYRRMEDIKESEAESVADLTAFLEAELTYHERCREVLLQLKNSWPTSDSQSPADSNRRSGRARSNTARSYQDRYEPVQEEERIGSSSVSPERTAMRGTTRAASAYQSGSPPRDIHADTPPRPLYGRAPTFNAPAQHGRDMSPPAKPAMSRVASDSAQSSVHNLRSQLRVVPCGNNYSHHNNEWTDDSMSYKGSPDRGSVSPAASTNGSVSSRATTTSTAGKKAPPPPPPSRSTKPPPPPPPVRRTTATVDM